MQGLVFVVNFISKKKKSPDIAHFLTNDLFRQLCRFGGKNDCILTWKMIWKFSKMLCGTVISGSFVTQCMLNEEWDIDIYVPVVERNTPGGTDIEKCLQCISAGASMTVGIDGYNILD